ncbi:MULTISPECIES: pyocin knob domain-containing protein [unclassified Aeromicrobium]|uniref:pyocin knob domain-containing protein n=1 Tax=unclassified Aeromicrobium TaxID=2633570 RepID=UPI00288C63A8|nr:MULTISPECIES: pyocin knob domain-containing protein [unclassified Aeromicrobium]
MNFYPDAPTRAVRIRPDVLAVGGTPGPVRVTIRPALGDARRIMHAPTGTPITVESVVVHATDEPTEVQVLASDALDLVDAQGGIIERFPYVAVIQDGTDPAARVAATATFYADSDPEPLDVDTVLGSGPPALPDGTPVYDQVLDLVEDARRFALAADEDALAADTHRQNAQAAASYADGQRAAAQAARDQADGHRQAAQVARTGAEDARAGAQSERAAAEAARAAVQALSFNGTALGTQDLNTVVSPGIYIQGTPANATLATNYPFASALCILEVYRLGVGFTLQRITPTGGILSAARGIWQRRQNGGTWDPWRFIPSQRVDQTAGRAIYTWDDLNGRDQLVYGDTGLRDVSSLLVNGWALGSLGVVLIRRVGVMVYLTAFNLDSANASAAAYANLPVGFRPSTISVIPIKGVASAGANAQDLNALARWNGELSAGITTRSASVIVSGAWMTADAWPTTLPGAANGAIPNL